MAWLLLPFEFILKHHVNLFFKLPRLVAHGAPGDKGLKLQMSQSPWKQPVTLNTYASAYCPSGLVMSLLMMK